VLSEARPQNSAGTHLVDIDVSIVGDLVAALGAEKTTSTADRFFEEMAESIALLRGFSPAIDQEQTSEMAHRLRGAAVMLGLAKIARSVDAVSVAADAGDDANYLSSLEELSENATVSKAAFAKLLKEIE